MFEKSKSAITFKEFESKMNIVNNFDSDWGHFCDTDIFNTNTNANNFNQLFQNNLQKPKKRGLKTKLSEKIEAQEQEQEQAQEENQEEDIEKQKEEKEQAIDIEKNNYEDNKIITVIEKIMNCIQMTFITLTMAYFIFKVI